MYAIHEFTQDLKILDVTQRLKLDKDGEIVFNFGKYNGQRVKDVIIKERNYYHWIMEKDFSVQVKKIMKKIMEDYLKEQKEKNM